MTRLRSVGQIVKGFIQLRVNGAVGREFKMKFLFEFGDRKLLEELFIAIGEPSHSLTQTARCPWINDLPGGVL
ncbi:hypothetical protein D3C75_978540 [compost metagenome]